MHRAMIKSKLRMHFVVGDGEDVAMGALDYALIQPTPEHICVL